MIGAVPAGAATASLTVMTIGRDGALVAGQVTVSGVNHPATYYLTTGKAASLPQGTYDVLADVFNPRDNTDTLGVKRVTLTGTTKITIDARAGQALRASLSPAPASGYAEHFLMALCSTVSLVSTIDAYTLGDVVYVIPSSLTTIETVLSSVWQPQDPQSHNPLFLDTTTHRDGIPSGGTLKYSQSSLATVAIHAYSGPVTGASQVELWLSSSDPCRDQLSQLDTSLSLPASFTVHVPAGTWWTDERTQDYISNSSQSYAAGHTYSLSINHAAWGPGGQLPYVWGSGHRLYLNTTQPFADSTLDSGAGNTTTYVLTSGGRTILSSTLTNGGTTLNPVITSRGWYTLSESAVRHPRIPLPAGALSPRSSLVMHFYADPALSVQVKGYVTRFNPLGLDSYDRADPGTTTTINLALLRSRPLDGGVKQPSDSVASVKAWYSADGGHTWHAATVKHPSTGWSAVVPNGLSGYVSLRSTVTDISGSTTTSTVYQAYALG
jgi:hypothetical protein